MRRLALASALLLVGCDGALLRGFAQAMVMVALIWLALMMLAALGELVVLGLVLRGFRRGEAAKLPLKLGMVAVLLTHAGMAANAAYMDLSSRGRAEPGLWLLCLSVALPAAGCALALSPAAIPRSTAWNARLGGAVLAAAVPVLLSCLLLWPWSEHAVPPGGAPVQLAQGADWDCARTSLGEVACWGDDSAGQLGVPPRPSRRERPSLVPDLGPVQSLVGGRMHACVLASGAALCWGGNEDGQLGQGTQGAAFSPTPLPGLGQVVEIGAASSGTWAREAGGRLVAFGKGLTYEAGPGPFTLGVAPSDTAQTAVGEGWWCVRRAGGGLSCAADGQDPQDLGVLCTDLAGAGDDACAVRQDGRVLCFAPRQAIYERQRAIEERARMAEIQAQMADLLARAGLEPDPPSPAAEPAEPELSPLEGLAGVADVVAEEEHFCAITRSGEVWCWGTGFRGGLGDGSATDHADAQRVSLPAPAKGISLSEDLSCAFLTDGRSFCWGQSPPGAPDDAYTLCHETWLGPLRCVPRPAEVRWW